MRTLLLSMALSIGLSFSFSAQAKYKEIGGGNGVGGTLLDRASAGRSTELDGFSLEKVVLKTWPQIFSRFPILKLEADRFFTGRTSKTFFTETREFHPDCINESTATTPGQTVWACQNDVEVRIRDTFWASAPEQTKADLLLHELLTSFCLGRRCLNSVAFAFDQLVHQTDDHVVQAEFWRVGLPRLYTKAQVDSVRSALVEFSDELARAPSNISQESIGIMILDLGLARFQQEFETRELFSEAAFFYAQENPAGLGGTSTPETSLSYLDRYLVRGADNVFARSAL